MTVRKAKGKSGSLFRKEVSKLCKAWAKQFRLEMADADNLEAQIVFIDSYISSMELDGESEQTLGRIGYFLQMQTPESKGEMMKIIFASGYPDDAFVYVAGLQDIDLAEVYSLTHFEKMIVTQADNMKWTKKAADAFFREVEEDFYFDYTKDEITFDYAYKGNSLEVFVTMNFEDEDEED